MTLTRDQILGANDLPIETIYVPRFGGDVRVRAMPMVSPAYTNFVFGRKKGAEPTPAEISIRRNLGAVIMSVIDENGDRIFGWADADDLREKHWVSLLKISALAFELAGEETPGHERCPKCNGAGRLPVAQVEEIQAELGEEAALEELDASLDEPVGDIPPNL